ncbi:helix-turn-helix domain-containing protein [Amycolatopsis ruanii]
MTMTSLADVVAVAPAASGPKVEFGSWTHAVQRSVLRFRFDCERPRAFAGIVSNRPLADVNFVDMESGRHAAYRDAATISPDEPDFYVMTLQLSGKLWLAQDGRVTVLEPGHFALYDSARPATIVSSDDYRSTCIRFPKRYLPAPPPGITATAFECEPGLPSTVWGMLLSLNRNVASLGPHGPRAVRTVMDLVTVMLHGTRTLPGRREVLLAHVREWIEEHLGDPDLGPAAVAAAHYISPRHLHNLFAGTGSTVSSWIRARRVEGCRRDLADPRLATVPVAAIAARWGFRGASHFGQVFKRATGRTPVEFRAESLADLR